MKTVTFTFTHENSDCLVVRIQGVAMIRVFSARVLCVCSAPERVMLCLIPDMAGSPDVGMHIQHTLVRSFCWENDIRLLTVRVLSG